MQKIMFFLSILSFWGLSGYAQQAKVKNDDGMVSSICEAQVIIASYHSSIIPAGFNESTPLHCGTGGDMCYIHFEMSDDYGDGWTGGASIAVMVDGTSYDIVTIPYGNFATADVLVPSGELKLSWNTGDYDCECEFKVYGPEGELIYASPASGPSGPSPCNTSGVGMYGLSGVIYTGEFNCGLTSNISGTVLRQNSTSLDKGSVSLYKVKTTGYYTLIETIPIKSDGTYVFTKVEDGDYVVRAMPDEPEHALPTYYGDTEHWDEATPVTVANSVSVDGIDIKVIPYGLIMDGTSFVSGWVVAGDKRGLVGGVDVYIQTSEQGDTYQTAGGTITDETGTFSFENIPQGTYRVMLDIPGLGTDNNNSRVLNIHEGDTTTNIVLTIPSLSINSPAKEEMIKVYPNPTTGELTITNYELRITNVEVFDVYGRKQLSTLNSQFSTQIDISRLPTGMYFLRIQTDKGVVTKKIIKQ